MVDLSTTYLGLKLKNPLVASASPLSKKVDTAVALEQAGVSAIVMYSLFEEQIEYESLRLDRDMSRGEGGFAEAYSFLPTYGAYSAAPKSYPEHLSKIKQAVSIPVIGSLNGVSSGGWVSYAREIQDAGADALELNLYDVAASPHLTSTSLEDRHVELVSKVRAAINIPLAVKLSPFYTVLPHFVRRLVDAGANGLVLFNRFYQPDFDLEALHVVPNLVLSSSHEMRLPLRWIAILHGQVQADFALTSGVHTSADVIKAVMAGSNVAMTASMLLQNGLGSVRTVLDGVQAWMEEREYDSISQMRGSMSQQAVADPEAFERANYMRVLSAY